MEDWLCPISKEIMSDPVQLADGTRYDLKSIVPWLLFKAISPLTNLPISYRIIFDETFADRIPRHLRTTTKMDRSFEQEEWDGTWLTAPQTELERYGGLRRLYWLIAFDDDDIPENERLYINYNQCDNGLGGVWDERPSGKRIECYFERYPNRFVTVWKIIRKDDIDSLLHHLWMTPDVASDYLEVNVSKRTMKYWRLRWKIRYVKIWLRLRLVIRKTAKTTDSVCFDTGIALLPIGLVILCVTLWLAGWMWQVLCWTWSLLYVITPYVDLSLSGSIFTVSLCLTLMMLLNSRYVDSLPPE